MVHTCDPFILRMEAEEAQGHPQLNRKFEASLSFRKPCLKKRISFSDRVYRENELKADLKEEQKFECALEMEPRHGGQEELTVRRG